MQAIMALIVLRIRAGRLGGPPKLGRVQLDFFVRKMKIFLPFIFGLLAVLVFANVNYLQF